jgi:hypothetical protein
MDLIGSGRDVRAAKAQIREWAREVLVLSDGDTVTVAELECAKPDCPPHETVVLVACAGRPTWQHKIPKPADAVTRGDLDGLVDAQGGAPT